MGDRARSIAGGLALLALAGCVRAPAGGGDAPASRLSGVGMTVPSPAETYPRCPPAATGARTSVQDVEGGVALDVTGNDLATSRDIADRTQALLAVAARGREELRHTGEGDGPGLGRCPVVLHDAHLSATPIDRGMRILVVTGPDEVAWLRRETRARLVELRMPASSKGLGMDHCPSALPSAHTEVSDAPDGVVVTVTAHDPDVTEAIRARAWHVAEESRRPGAHAEHAPLAANVRPCPVVLTDTLVEARDVPGGSEISVRARLTGEEADVRRHAHERAAAFR